MATTVISNSCVAGAMGALLGAHFNGSVTPGDYAAIANAAAAIAAEFITVNAGSGAALADADNNQIGPLVQSVTYGTLMLQGAASTTATDYLSIAKQIYAASKQGLTKLA